MKSSENTKVKSFEIEESKVNKGCMCLIAIDENGKKWVCSGTHWSPTYLTEYDKTFDTKES